MQKIIFTEEYCKPENLHPFTYTRHIQDIRVGILTIREKWERYLKLPSADKWEDYYLDTGDSVSQQMRPVLMTCMIAAVGLLPAAVSNGIGSQVQKPLAVVVVGGMTLAPIVILVALPVLIALFSRRRAAVSHQAIVAEPAE